MIIKTLRNQQGIALVTALLLTMMSLVIISAILYMVNQGISTSGAQKRYHNSLEAAHGGLEVFAKEIVPRLIKGETVSSLTAVFPNTMAFVGTTDACLAQKLALPPSGWSSCASDSTDINPKLSTDLSFRLNGAAGQGNYKVYTKIVDTTAGNSDSSGFDLLDGGSGVTGTSSGVSPKHIPAMYRIEVQGEKELNPQERAKLSVLYAY